MTPEEASVLVGRMRGTWPRMYIVDDGLDVWLDYFARHDFDLAYLALRKLTEALDRVPGIKDFADIIEGEKTHRVKCPHCGIGWPSEARLAEHVENVHYDLVPSP